MSEEYKLETILIRDNKYPERRDVTTTGRWKIVTTYSGTVVYRKDLAIEVEYIELETFPAFKKSFPFMYMKEYIEEKHNIWCSEEDLCITKIINEKDSEIFTCEGENNAD